MLLEIETYMLANLTKSKHSKFKQKMFNAHKFLYLLTKTSLCLDLRIKLLTIGDMTLLKLGNKNSFT